MNKRAHRIAMPLVCVPVMTLAASGQEPQAHGRLSAPSHWMELMGSMETMDKSMTSLNSSGDVDIDFVSLMLLHHQAALDMAKIELLNGMNSQIRRLAQEIVTDQQSEIELMRLWLKQRER